MENKKQTVGQTTTLSEGVTETQNEKETQITRDEFERYENVRVGGRTNMFMVSNVMALSGLSKSTIMQIMKEYSELCKIYLGVRK